MEELVCPEFYVDAWRKDGSIRSTEPNEQFPVAMDDGVCRVVAYDRATETLTCRCGRRFTRLEAQRVPVQR